MAKEYKNNHYVPIWYQKRFVLDPKSDHELHYLDLNPPRFTDSKGGVHTRGALRKNGFKQCFAEKDLYTTNFNNIESEKIEKYFFGDIDTRGGIKLLKNVRIFLTLGMDHLFSMNCFII